jgi:hypothetical protein
MNMNHSRNRLIAIARGFFVSALVAGVSLIPGGTALGIAVTRQESIRKMEERSDAWMPNYSSMPRPGNWHSPPKPTGPSIRRIVVSIFGSKTRVRVIGPKRARMSRFLTGGSCRKQS